MLDSSLSLIFMPKGYLFSSSSALIVSPLLVVVLPIRLITTSRLVSGLPLQFSVIWQNIRCSILFHLLVPGGKCATWITSNSHFEKNQTKFSDLNREFVSKHHFLTDNYHRMLEIDFLFENLSMKNRFQLINLAEILTNFVFFLINNFPLFSQEIDIFQLEFTFLNGTYFLRINEKKSDQSLNHKNFNRVRISLKKEILVTNNSRIFW